MKKQLLGKAVVVAVVLMIFVVMLFTVGFVNPLFAHNYIGHNTGTDVYSEDEKKDYLIGFHQEPGYLEVNMVELLGGEIYRQFSLINVIAARMTSDAASELAQEHSVKYVEPDAPVFRTSQETPWGIDRVFGNESYSFNTWEITKGDGTAVAILDSGIAVNHEDIYPLVLGGINTLQGADPNNYYDDHGHGTHVAGTVAALDNELGVVGVGPEIGLYAVKVIDNQGRGTWSSVAAGIEWAVEKNIPFLNMSLGGSDGRTLRDACDAAYSAGHILVAAAGNSGNYSGTGNNVVYPAAYSSVIAVAASDQNDNRAFFSSTGPDVELIAPGQRILSTWRLNRYIIANGTSMASPHVAASAALTWAVNPDLTNVQVRELLQQTAQDLNLPENHQGYGLVRADLAVRAALELVEPATGNIEGKVTGKQGAAIEGATVAVEDSDLAVVTGTEGHYRLEDVPEGKQEITVSAEDYYSQTVEVYIEKDVTISHNFFLESITPIYIIAATAGTGGEIKPSAAVEIYEGESQTFIISPDTGYAIGDVLVDGESVSAVNSYTFENVTSDHTIHAEFAANPAYTLSGRVTDYGGDALENATVVIEETGLSAVTEADGSYKISGVEEGTYKFTADKKYYRGLTKELTVEGDVANFDFVLKKYPETVFTVTASAGEGGEIIPSAAVKVYEGEDQTFTIIPDSDYKIYEVLVDDEAVEAVSSYTFENVRSDHTIHAEFEMIPTYTVSGMVRNYDGEALDEVTVEVEGTGLSAITEADGTYAISGVEKGAYGITASKDNYAYNIRKIKVEADISNVNFFLKKTVETVFTVTASAGVGGEITPSSVVEVHAGESQTFKIRPDSGYEIYEVLVDDQVVEAVSSYTFENVRSDHTIHAEFDTAPIFTVSGTVRNYFYETLEGVTVKIVGTGLSAVTEADGTYAISGVKKGTYGITAGKDNYADDIRKIKVETDISNINFFLKKTAETVFTVTASAGVGGVIIPSSVVEVHAGGN